MRRAQGLCLWLCASLCVCVFVCTICSVSQSVVHEYCFSLSFLFSEESEMDCVCVCVCVVSLFVCHSIYLCSNSTRDTKFKILQRQRSFMVISSYPNFWLFYLILSRLHFCKLSLCWCFYFNFDDILDIFECVV